jgi:hypothetical protein
LPKEPNSAVFGNPEFWTTSYQSFRKFFEVSPRLNDALGSITHRAYENVEPLQKLILNLGILTGVSFVELITLVGNGCGPGAMKIARSILESTINAEYLRRFPEEYDNFLRWRWVEQHNWLNYMREFAPDLLERVSPTTITQSEEEFERVRPQFEYKTARGETRLRAHWCSLDLGSRAAKTDFLEPYRTLNPFASQILHGTASGLAALFDPEEDTHRIGVPPSLNWCGESLVGGHLCVLKIVETLASALDVAPCYPVEKLTEDYHYAWSKASGDRAD